MTCIVGIEFNNNVYMLGDLCASDGNSMTLITRPKVFVKGGVVFGYTTSFRFGQILEFMMPTMSPPSSDILEWLITVFVSELRTVLDKASFKDSFQCLVGIKGELYTIQEDFSVLRSANGYTSIGSGSEVALGSLFTSTGDVEARCKTAILAAAHFCPGVSTECSGAWN